MGFAERSALLSPARSEELAELLQPLHHEHGRHAVDKVLAYARSIAGGA